MGNRLTLPLLLVAALLAGGAFFWLSDGGRRSGRAEADSAPRAAAPAKAPSVALRDAGVSAPVAGTATAPARVEVAESPLPKPLAGAKEKEGDKGHGVRVTGQVVDRFGTPIAGARVVVAKSTGFPMDLELERDFSWLKRQRAASDATGHFELADVEPGTLQVAVRAHGFAPYEQKGVTVTTRETALEPFVLARGAILSGVVVDPAGRGVGGAKILRGEVDEGAGLFLIGQREPSAVSAADGSFRIDELACGAWRFSVRSEDHPDFTAEGMAEEPGVEQGGLRWQLAPGATIGGTVTGIPSGERDQLEVRALRSQPGAQGFFGLAPSRSAKVAPDGSFLARGLEVGQTYTLQARRAEREETFDAWERSRSNNVNARAGDSGVVLAYQPEAAVLFTVFDGLSRAPIEKFQVESGVDWTQPLRDEEGRPRSVFPGGVVRVGELRPGSSEERVQLLVKATGYRDYQRADIALRAGQELDLGAIYLDPVPVVRVHVTDQKSGAPIAGASVRLQKDQGDSREVRRTIALSNDGGGETIEFGEGRSAKSDELGWAELSSFEGETVQVTVRADGYAPFRLGGLFLPKGQRVEQEARLTLGGEVLVHVKDAAGVPKAGAKVGHRSSAIDEPGHRLLDDAGGKNVSDAEGDLLFTNLEAGEHSFRLDEDGGGAAFFGTTEMVVLGGSDAGDSEEWSAVVVEEGQRAELTLVAAPRGMLSGRVREAGKVLAGATVRLTKEGEGATGPERGFALPGMGGGPEARSDGEGRYQLDDVKEGGYRLTVEHPTRRMPQDFPLELRAGDNTFDVDLSLAIIEGQVVDGNGKGVAGVRVWPERLESDEGGQRMQFRMVMINDSGGGVIDSGQFGQKAVTDADGRYSLRGVTSDVQLVVKAEGDSVQPGQSETVRVAPDEVKRSVDLKLEVAGSISIEAKLADGAPARFQLVQAEYLDKSEEPIEPKFGFLQAGSTSLKGLKPGRWKVNVRSPQGGPNDQNPGQDQEVLVKPGETASATFEVE